jgi:hypothetical protein
LAASCTTLNKPRKENRVMHVLLLFFLSAPFFHIIPHSIFIILTVNPSSNHGKSTIWR